MVVKSNSRGAALPLLASLHAAEASGGRLGRRLDVRPRTNRRRPSHPEPSELQGAKLTSKRRAGLLGLLALQGYTPKRAASLGLGLIR
jgi:hypothetical protein